jgi:hypothetical protein
MREHRTRDEARILSLACYGTVTARLEIPTHPRNVNTLRIALQH